jgi:hypothetical protein
VEWILALAGIIFLTMGFIGHAFEMRKTRLSESGDKELGSINIFMNKKNFKWYAIIGIGIILWIMAERT